MLNPVVVGMLVGGKQANPTKARLLAVAWVKPNWDKDIRLKSAAERIKNQ